MRYQQNTPTSLSLYRSTIGHSQGTAIAVIGAQVVIDQCLVHDTVPDQDTHYGDALGIQSALNISDVTVSNSMIEASSRAAVFNLGSRVTLQDNHLRCQALDLDGEHGDVAAYEFIDGGGNLCGCPAATEDCALVSTNLSPPSPLPPLEQ